MDIISGDATGAGAKSPGTSIYYNFPRKFHNYGNFRRCQSRCDDLRRPKKGRPRGASITLETPPLPSQEPGIDAIRTFTIFHGWVRTIPIHARFY